MYPPLKYGSRTIAPRKFGPGQLPPRIISPKENRPIPPPRIIAQWAITPEIFFPLESEIFNR